MKKFLLMILLAVLPIAPVVLVPALCTGCASAPASYKTLAATQAATTAVLNAFAEARVKGKVSDADYVKVDAAYRKYQAAFETAVAAARLDLKTATPAEVVQLATALSAAITAATGGAK